jgi:hypothetical protein
MVCQTRRRHPQVKISEAIEELQRVQYEHGDQELMMADTFEETWRTPIDRLEYEPDRDAVTAVSDR